MEFEAYQDIQNVIRLQLGTAKEMLDELPDWYDEGNWIEFCNLFLALDRAGELALSLLPEEANPWAYNREDGSRVVVNRSLKGKEE